MDRRRADFEYCAQWRTAYLAEHDRDEAATHARPRTAAEPDRVFAGRDADQAIDRGQPFTGSQRVAHSACFGQRRDGLQEVSATGWGSGGSAARSSGWML